MILPSWMRAIQQSVWFHLVQSAGLAGAVAYFTCDPSRQTQSCLEVGVAAFLGALYLTFQHSPGSTSFRTDGAPLPAAAQLKQLADTAVQMQAKAVDPASPVTPAEATKVTNTVDRLNLDVLVQNKIVQEALANEEKKP